MYRVELPANILLGFKAAPGPNGAELLEDAGNAGEDWAGLYAQLSVPAAVNYLPNQWTRGAESACLLSVRTRTPVSVIVCPHKWMGDTAVSSAEKAARVRRLLLAEINVAVRDDKPLLAGLGELGFALAAIDADEFELVVPHNLVTRFAFDVVATVTQYEKCRYTTGGCQVLVGEKIAIPRQVAQDSAELGKALASALEGHVGDCSTVLEILKIAPSTR